MDTNEEKNKYKILIVEDEPSLRDALQKSFERKNFTVLTAEDGEKGMQSAMDNLPSLILLDIMMPHIDGFSTLQLLKGKQETKDIPVILLTNLGQDEDRKRGHELGAVEYLVKADTPLEEIIKISLKYL